MNIDLNKRMSAELRLNNRKYEDFLGTGSNLYTATNSGQQLPSPDSGSTEAGTPLLDTTETSTARDSGSVRPTVTNYLAIWAPWIPLSSSIRQRPDPVACPSGRTVDVKCRSNR